MRGGRRTLRRKSWNERIRTVLVDYTFRWFGVDCDLCRRLQKASLTPTSVSNQRVTGKKAMYLIFCAVNILQIKRDGMLPGSIHCNIANAMRSQICMPILEVGDFEFPEKSSQLI